MESPEQRLCGCSSAEGFAPSPPWGKNPRASGSPVLQKGFSATVFPLLEGQFCFPSHLRGLVPIWSSALLRGSEQRASSERDRGWGRKGFGCLGWGKALCCLTTVTAESTQPPCIKHEDCPRFSVGKLRHAPVEHGFCPQINSLGSGTPSR